ncbi:MAG: hypothetical protein MN733_14275, partial [Nitrososphaera sp.]|nr:hypothetical protein [Nitrososphaera sp.]
MHNTSEAIDECKSLSAFGRGEGVAFLVAVEDADVFAAVDDQRIGNAGDFRIEKRIRVEEIDYGFNLVAGGCAGSKIVDNSSIWNSKI